MRAPGARLVQWFVHSHFLATAAGSFGYKSPYYGLSAELGRRLAAELDALGAVKSAPATPPETPCYLACGTSCRAQINDLAGHQVRHPVELIDERLDNP